MCFSLAVVQLLIKKGLMMIIDFNKARGGKKINKIDEIISKKLAYLRTSRGFSQEELGHMSGVCTSQLRKYEEGINRITAGRLKLLVDALGVQISTFFETDFGFPDVAPSRLALEMQRNFLRIKHQGTQQALCSLIKALADREAI